MPSCNIPANHDNPAKNNDCKIVSFGFTKALNAGLDKDYSAAGDSTANAWASDAMTPGTLINVLVATFELPSGASAKVGETAQESGKAVNDFSSDVNNSVTDDGTTTYLDKVRIASEQLLSTEYYMCIYQSAHEPVLRAYEYRNSGDLSEYSVTRLDYDAANTAKAAGDVPLALEGKLPAGASVV